jgi:thiamine-monophosphate kinase
MQLSEDDLIATLFAPMAGPGGLGLKDDAALLAPPPGCELVLTKDALVASVHFFPDDPPGCIARKALRTNLSDLAAKGCDPLGFLLAVALPDSISADWLRAFAAGLGDDASSYGCALLGGDTVKTPGPLMVSITALGSVPIGRMARRTGARPGDLIYVSGTIGDAALGLAARLDPAAFTALSATHRDHLLDRYLLPRPRNALARAVRDHANGSMDVSDGLVGDLTKMLKVSGVGAQVTLADIPLSDAARAAIDLDPARFERAVTGGDDYEILCTVPPEAALSFESAAADAGVLVTRTGQIRDGSGPVFLDSRGAEQRFKTGSYSHF